VRLVRVGHLPFKALNSDLVKLVVVEFRVLM